MQKLYVALLLSAFSLSSQAYVIGDPNFGIGGYPEFNKYPPSAPYSRSELDYRLYRDEVENYVNEAKRYIEAADNDIERIQEQKEEAVRKANQAVEEFNSWARRY